MYGCLHLVGSVVLAAVVAPSLPADAAVTTQADGGPGTSTEAPNPVCVQGTPHLTPISIRININRMRTTLDLPAALLDEAQELLGFKSKTDTVVLSLTELVRRRRIEELKGLAGQVDLGLDLDRSRRRSSAGPTKRKAGPPGRRSR